MNEQKEFATVTVTYPDNREEVFAIQENQTVSIGRELSNEITIHDSSVSRVHASLKASATGLLLADHASLNGTYVNGVKMTTMRMIAAQDLINLGPIKIRAAIHNIEGLSSSLANNARAMTAQLKPCSVTLLVANVLQYVEIAKAVPPSKAANTLAKWSEAVTNIILEHRGQFEKFVNSSIVAKWITNEETNSCHAALNAAKLIHEFTLNLAENNWEFQEQHPWKAKIILNTGHGLIGKMSGNDERNFIVLGDPVNSTFKLAEETQASEYPIIISKTIVDHLDNSEKFIPIENSDGKAFTLSNTAVK
ncbi:MAG: FHA domain-containing protein [Bdellovibrionota bacterium]